jgi:hypothetical protein
MSLSFSRMRTPWLMLSLGCKILYYWPAVGWIEGEVVKRNVDRRMKIGSDIVNFFVFYKHDDDTSTPNTGSI